MFTQQLRHVLSSKTVDNTATMLTDVLSVLTSSLHPCRCFATHPSMQLLGLSGCGRKRLLMLWAALDLVRTGGAGPAALAAGSGVSSNAVMDLGPAAGAAVDVWGLLKLSLTAMEPPDQPGQQVGLCCACVSPQQDWIYSRYKSCDPSGLLARSM